MDDFKKINDRNLIIQRRIALGQLILNLTLTSLSIYFLAGVETDVQCYANMISNTPVAPTLGEYIDVSSNFALLLWLYVVTNAIDTLKNLLEIAYTYTNN